MEPMEHYTALILLSFMSGSVDGKILVEDDGGQITDFTTVTWQIGLGETLCYRFRSEASGAAGAVEVTYTSLKARAVNEISRMLDAFSE